MTTVLALRALGLGDTLTAVPALRALRRAFPGARLTLAGPPGPVGLLLELGIVDELVPAVGLGPFAWPHQPPDVAVNLHGCGPQSHELLLGLRPGRLVAYACPPDAQTPPPDAPPPSPIRRSDGSAHRPPRTVRVPTTDARWTGGPAWAPGEHEVDRWLRLAASARGTASPEDLVLWPSVARARHVVLHPGAAAAGRRWPADRWVAVARGLAGQGRAVAVTGTEDERELCREVAAAADGIENRCGIDDLGSLAHLVRTAALVLCGDTGLAHLATATRTPSVVLFGPEPPSRWGPRIDTDRHVVIWRPDVEDPPGDPHSDVVDVRLARIHPQDVLAAAQPLLRSSDAAPDICWTPKMGTGSFEECAGTDTISGSITPR